MNIASSRLTGAAEIARRPYTSRVTYRLLQGIGAMVPTLPDDRDAILATNLTAEQGRVFRQLATADQAHLLRTLRTVVAADPDASADLRVAALLHDVGKASPDGRVRLVHRVLRVAMGKWLPNIWRRLAALPASGWRTGFVLAEHHPALGATIAERLCCSERTCWLIREHGRTQVPPNIDDLRSLMSADHHAR